MVTSIVKMLSYHAVLEYSIIIVHWFFSEMASKNVCKKKQKNQKLHVNVFAENF